MTSTRARRAVATTFAVAAVLAGAGCGGEDDADAAARCRSQAYNAAEAAVVAQYYEEGKLGSKESVHAALDQPGMQFFDGRDRMIPYEQLDSDEQSVLVLWFNHDRVGVITEDDREAAVEATDPDC